MQPILHAFAVLVALLIGLLILRLPILCAESPRLQRDPHHLRLRDRLVSVGAFPLNLLLANYPYRVMTPNVES